MIDLLAENTLSLNAAAKKLPAGRRGRPVTLSCLIRWITDGAKGPTGERIRLEAIRLGGRWITSTEALQRFAAALTPNAEPEAPAARTPGQRQRASERAAQQLGDAGI
jgi:hypothetical protein